MGVRSPTGLLVWCFAILAGAASIRAASATSPRTHVPLPPRTFRVVLDPGHGGKAEFPGETRGDAWDAAQGRFLRIVNFGGAVRLSSGRELTERALCLDLCQRVQRLLDLTATDVGWQEFAKMLSRLGAQGPLTRVVLRSSLTRTDDCSAREARREADPNRDFRLFDTPVTLPAPDGTPLHPGRVSRIVAEAPELVVVVHMNDESGGRARGMNALFVPGPDHFEALRQVARGKRAWDPQLSRLERHWVSRGRARGTRESMLESAWVHFTGFGPASSGRVADLRRPAGLLHNGLTWAYRDASGQRPHTTLAGPFVGPFWTREAGPAEKRRRQGGPEGLGGDNLYAGQELLRHVRVALWRDRLAGAAGPPRELFGTAPAPAQVLGPLDKPLCAPWTIPLGVNSVAAYLELGYLSNPRDRWLLTARRDAVATGLAAGIYSLATGLRLAPTTGVTPTRGAPVDWLAYRGYPEQARWKGTAGPVVRRLGGRQ